MRNRVLGLAALVVGVVGCCAAAMPASATPIASKPAISATTGVSHSTVPLSAYPLRCVVTGSNVNYRRGPGTQYASFGQVNRGFTFASDGGVPNPRSRYQYWNNLQRPGHADAYVDAAYVYCWLA